MTDTTARLSLPWLMPAQAQKHVTVNEALRRLDGLVQAAVQSRSETSEPPSPDEGQGWILPEGATGTHWDGFAGGDLVIWQDGTWTRHVPGPGWRVWVIDAAELAVFDGEDWQGFSPGGGNVFAELGVGTSPDEANPFAAKLNAALWTAREEGEGGSGDLRYTLNKQAPENVLSLLFQSGWQGRAEMGLVGDDDVQLKVSDDGENWKEALRVDSESARVDMPSGLAVAGLPASAMIFTPGGDNEVSVWRIDGDHGANPRSATLASISGAVLTLSAPVAGQFYNFRMAGVSLVRIWNMTRSPIQPAWLAAIPGASQLTVSNTADIAGWQAGDTIQLGDPVSEQLGGVIAVDISPMMQSVLGKVFPQTGIMLRTLWDATTPGDQISVTPAGVQGSHIAAAITGAQGKRAGGGVTIIPTITPSPVSNSNLLLVREWIASSSTLSAMYCLAVFG